MGNTGKGVEEITSIISNHKDEAIIIVDDVRLLGKGPTIGNDICNREEINIENILKIERPIIISYHQVLIKKID